METPHARRQLHRKERGIKNISQRHTVDGVSPLGPKTLDTVGIMERENTKPLSAKTRDEGKKVGK